MSRRIDDINYLTPELQLFTYTALEVAKRYNLHFTIFETYRTPERQAELISKGQSWTTIKKAKHCQRKAVDIVYKDSKGWSWFGSQENRTDAERSIIEAEYYAFALLVKAEIKVRKLNIKWGGDWKKKDLPHWEEG